MRPLLRRTLPRTLSAILPLLLALAAPTLLAQTTRTVGAGQTYTTIQSAIDAAASGDTVLVYPGTYYENIDFKGKAITMTSTSGSGGGAANTILDGGNTGPVVYIGSTDRNAPAQLLNFTVQHGAPVYSFGSYTNVYNYGSGVVAVGFANILGNTIQNNTSCGVDIETGGATVSGNHIVNNIAANTAGADCRINAYGVYVGLGTLSNLLPPLSLVISNNLIEGNSNGGIGFNQFDGNQSVLIEKNVIRNNSLTGQYTGGSGLALDLYTSATIRENLIYGNGGYGIFALGGNFYLYNNTVYQNSHFPPPYIDPNSVGTEVSLSATWVQAENNIIVGTDAVIPALYCGAFPYSPSYGTINSLPSVFDHNLIYNTTTHSGSIACDTNSTWFGNLFADPLFRNPATFDLHLLAGSSAIDSGNNSVIAQGATDLEGNARVQDATGIGYPIVDMGVYEVAGLAQLPFTTTTLILSQTIANAGNGTIFATVHVGAGNNNASGNVSLEEDGAIVGSGALDATGSIVIDLPVTVPGMHALRALYPGSTGFPASQSIKTWLAVNKYQSSLTLAAPSPVVINQPVTVSVTAESADNAVLTPIAVTDTTTGATLATLTPDTSGHVSFSTTFTSLGLHTLSAYYAGDATHSLATATANVNVVSGLPTTTTLSSTANPSNYGQPVTFTATVTAQSSTNSIPTGSVVFEERGTVLATVPLSPTGVASFTTSALTANDLGTSPYHLLDASFVPTGAFSGSSTSLSQVVNGLPSVTTLVVTPGSGNTSTSFALKATVASATPSSSTVPTGEVVFYSSAQTGIPGNELGYAPLINGVASLDTTGFLGGTDFVSGIYFGDNLYASSTSNYFLLTAAPSPSTLSLNASAPSIVAQTPVTFTVQLASAASAAVASQPLTLTLTPNGGTASVVVPLTTNATGLATFTTSTLSAGTYSVAASYAGNANLLASTAGPLLETVTPPPSTTTTGAVAPQPATYGQPETFTAHVAGSNGPANTVPSGQVLFTFCHGATTRATLDASGNASFLYPLPNTLSEPVGACPFTIAYQGDANYPQSTSAAIPWVVLPSSSATSLSSSAPSGYYTQPIVLTATIAGTPAPVLGPGGVILPPGATVGTGTVQFFANGALLGTGTVTNNVATLTVTSLGAGTDIVTAAYAGDANLQASTSGPLPEIITLPDFTVAAASPSLSIETLHRSNITFNLAALSGFNGPVTLACTQPYPVFLTCTAPTVTLPLNGTATVTMDVDTSGVPKFYGEVSPPGSPRGLPASAGVLERLTLALVLPLPFAWIARQRRTHAAASAARTARRRLPTLLLLVLLTAAATSLTACADHIPDGVAPGRYQIQVTATGQSSQVAVPESHIATFTLTVTK